MGMEAPGMSPVNEPHRREEAEEWGNRRRGGPGARKRWWEDKEQRAPAHNEQWERRMDEQRPAVARGFNVPNPSSQAAPTECASPSSLIPCM